MGEGRKEEIEKKEELRHGNRVTDEVREGDGIHWKFGRDVYTLSSVQSLSHVQHFVTP